MKILCFTINIKQSKTHSSFIILQYQPIIILKFIIQIVIIGFFNIRKQFPDTQILLNIEFSIKLCKCVIFRLYFFIIMCVKLSVSTVSVTVGLMNIKTCCISYMFSIYWYFCFFQIIIWAFVIYFWYAIALRWFFLYVGFVEIATAIAELISIVWHITFSSWAIMSINILFETFITIICFKIIIF